MNVIVHYPKNREYMNALRKSVAAVHAQAVITYIGKLQCPKEQKIELVNALIKQGSSG